MEGSFVGLGAGMRCCLFGGIEFGGGHAFC
jgi:hypothetical protein